MDRAWRQYSILLFVFLCAAVYNAGNIRYVLHSLRYPSAVAEAPFTLQNATRLVGSGALWNDEILSINGKPFTAKDQYQRAVALARPGDKLVLVLSEPSGRAIERILVFDSQAGRYSSTANIALTLCLDVFVPLVCLCLGFGVAFIRPHDRNAWLLLFVLIGFGGLLSSSDWYPPVPDLGLLWTGLCNTSWCVAMLLFVINFPTRFGQDRRRPWLKYLVIVPAIIVGITLWSILLLWNHDIDLAQRFRSLLSVLSPANLVLQMLTLSLFFMVLGVRSGTENAPGDRRRLRILRTGAALSFAPMFPIVLYAVIRGRDVLAGVPWPLQVFAFFMMALFPVTLAYVIVVERAMDLNFVIRQSVQYALARGGVRALRIVIIAIFVNMVLSASHATSAASWVRTMGIGLLGLVVLRQRVATKASTWVDRKFFREAYDAESVLSELAVEAGRYVEINPLLETVAQRISGTLHIPDIVMLIRDGESYRTRYSTRPGEPMDIAANGRIIGALREKNAPLEVYFDNPEPWIHALNAEEIQTLDFMRSQLLLPLKGRGSQDGQIIGILSLGPKKSEAPYSKTDIRLLQAVAWQMGMALENSRLATSLAQEAAHREVLNRELEIAREVQERLFPQKFPKVEGVDCFGYCRPARGVGGDYYDFVDQPDGKLGIAIGDVSGKGIAAALLMASLQASLRGQAMAGIHDLAELMCNVNKLVYDASQSNRYATFFYGEFDPANRVFLYVNAGHNAPVVLRGDEVVRLAASGPVVGLLPGVGYTMDRCQMQAGDIFIGYTDGISEAMNEQDEEWEEDRFIAAARACARGSAKELIEGVFRCADEFTGAAKQYDDMTLLVMKLAG